MNARNTTRATDARTRTIRSAVIAPDSADAAPATARPTTQAQSPAHTLRALYSPEHAAAYLDVSRASIYRWINAGRLAGFRVGRLRRFTRDELDMFAAELAEEGGAA